MNIKENLQKFYDLEANKYASTRNKHRPDADIILNQIKNSGKKTITILEYGCGSGRLLEQLLKLKGIKLKYTGIDISKELLKIAKKSTKDKTGIFNFYCDDITNYIKQGKQESFDFIVGTASFQHIPNIKERYFLIKNFYRLLKYEGEIIMTNRAPSKRFIMKYKKQIIESFKKFILSFGKSSFRDILVPRKSNKQIFYRFYHLFSLKELEKIAKAGGFIISKLTYLDKDGNEIANKRSNANNSLLIASKQIFTKQN